MQPTSVPSSFYYHGADDVNYSPTPDVRQVLVRVPAGEIMGLVQHLGGIDAESTKPSLRTGPLRVSGWGQTQEVFKKIAGVSGRVSAPSEPAGEVAADTSVALGVESQERRKSTVDELIDQFVGSTARKAIKDAIAEQPQGEQPRGSPTAQPSTTNAKEGAGGVGAKQEADREASSELIIRVEDVAEEERARVDDKRVRPEKRLTPESGKEAGEPAAQPVPTIAGEDVKDGDPPRPARTRKSLVEQNMERLRVRAKVKSDGSGRPKNKAVHDAAGMDLIGPLAEVASTAAEPEADTRYVTCVIELRTKKLPSAARKKEPLLKAPKKIPPVKTEEKARVAKPAPPAKR